MGLLVLFGVAAAIIIAGGTLALLREMQRPARLTYGVALARGLPMDPLEAGSEFENRAFNFSDGTQTPAWIVQGKQPDGPIIIVTHGWSGGRYGSLARLPMLAPFASQLVLYDVRGQGECTSKCTTLGPKETEDLVAIVDQVSWRADTATMAQARHSPAGPDESNPGDATAPDRPIVLLGASLGAAITLAAAAALQRQPPGRIAGVIAEAPYRRLAHPLAARLWLRRIPPQPFTALAIAHLRFWSPGFVAFDQSNHAAAITCPLLVLHGQNDPIAPFADSQKIAQFAPNSQLIPFPQGGHSYLWDQNPEKYRDALSHFFTQLRDPHTD